MREVKLKGHKVEIYTSIEELPMVRFHKYNKCLLVDAGIGSDLSSIDAHIERVVRFIRTDKKEEAGKELENLRQNVYMVLQEMSPQHMAFACMVAKIDGKDYEDISDEGLHKVLSILGDVPMKEITTQQEVVKKKIDEELMLYFPQIFDDSSNKEYYDKLKERTMAMLDGIIRGDAEGRKEKIERLTDELVTYIKPRCFSGFKSDEISYDKQFEDMCLFISQNLNSDAKRYSVMQYYNAYLYIEKQQKAQKRHLKSR